MSNHRVSDFLCNFFILALLCFLICLSFIVQPFFLFFFLFLAELSQPQTIFQYAKSENFLSRMSQLSYTSLTVFKDLIIFMLLMKIQFKKKSVALSKRLLHKISSYGNTGRIFSVIKVVVYGQSSGVLVINADVPQ